MTIFEIFVIYATIGSAVCSGALLWLIRKPKIPRWLDVVASIMLLTFAGLFLWMLQLIYNELPSFTTDQKSIKIQYQIALYLVPFFTAGLSTNILSNVILSHRDYTGTITFYEAATKLLWVVCFTILTLSMVGLMLYVAYKRWGEVLIHSSSEKPSSTP